MIKIKALNAGYTNKTVLKDISIDITNSEFVFILGQNGAGKSTLLKSINGIIKATAGDIYIKDKHLKDWHEKALARQIAFIPQDFHLQFDYTVFEVVLMGRYAWLGEWSDYTQDDRQITAMYLEKLGLADFADRYFNQLSGGERQRILIARALVQNTAIILMDESLSHLDINHQIEILRLLKEINNTEGKTIVMISHNLNLASEFAERIILLKNGQIIVDGTAETVFTPETIGNAFDMKINMITNPYTGKKNIVL